MSDGSDYAPCKFCRAQALRVEELEETVRQLREIVYGKNWEPPIELDLTAAQSAIVCAFVARERVCSISFLIEVTRGLPNCREDYPEDECIRTQISHLRKKLTPFGLEIQTVWARGYRLTPESRSKLLNWTAPTGMAA